MDLALPDPDRYDLVILAGDIHSYTHAIPWATRTFAKPVIYVPGNHEVYGAHYQGLWAELRKCAAQGHIHLLDNEIIEVLPGPVARYPFRRTQSGPKLRAWRPRQ